MTKLTFKNSLSPEMQARLQQMQQQQEAKEKNTPKSARTSDTEKDHTVSKKPEKDTNITKDNQQKDWKGQLQKIREVQIWLEETWPNLFSFQNPKPLKLHIELDIIPHLVAPFTKTRLRRALQAYVRRHLYLKAILENDKRFDLKGEEAEDISKEQKLFTRQKLEHKEQQYAERQQKKKAKHKKFSSNSGDNAPDKNG